MYLNEISIIFKIQMIFIINVDIIKIGKIEERKDNIIVLLGLLFTFLLALYK